MCILYEGEDALSHSLQTHNIIDNDKLLIQVYTSLGSKEDIASLLQTLSHYFQDAVIIGSTTDGEIVNGKVVTHETVLSFTQFNETILACAVCSEEESFLRGKKLASALVKKDTTLLIAFSDGLSTNGERFLKGINHYSPDITVAGGLAGDYARFQETFVFTKEKILTAGAVGVSLSGERLRLFNDYCFNWQKIGKALRVTKCDANRVYEIDGRSAIETYKHYLGHEVAELLPSIGIEFPLIGERNGMDVARAVIQKHSDGSLSFAGDIHEGEELYFGYGNLKKILEDSYRIPQKVASFQPEAIFIYSCMARRNFIGSAISQETEPLQEIAPTSGFFTYGEFFHQQSDGRNELMNQTMTVVALSESDRVDYKPISIQQIEEGSYHSINALIHLLNVTGQEVMEQKVFAQSYERFAQLFEYSGDGLIVFDGKKMIECNEKALKLFGYLPEEKSDFLLSKIDTLVVSVEAVDKILEKIEAQKSNSLLFTIEVIKRTGERFWTEVMMTRIRSGNETNYYMVLRDISERKAMEEQLQKQNDQLYQNAYRDDLTGLPNRKAIMEILEDEMMIAAQIQEKLALLFIDLDKLKVVNDSLGHLAGDKLIQIAAKRFSQVVSPQTVVSRLGGDEFLILLKGTDNDTIIAQAEKLLRISREEIRFDRNHLYISASIGIATFPKDAKDAYSLLKYADTAMYNAKEKGGNQYSFYSKELTQRAYEQIKIAKEFRRGIKQKEFVIYYQPQFNMKSGRIIGVEALIRWRHPEKGFLSPGKFLPAIEKANLLHRLDRWVMNGAMKEMVQWYKEGLNPGKLSLNIRMSELESVAWEEKLIKTMNRIGFDPQWLEIEITETEIMKRPDRVVALIETLHTHNISIAIDDFGTGYSSLAQLKYLPFDKLKIDKIFIDDLPENKDACVLFDMMMTLANNLNVPVLAEGMEQEEQIEYLQKAGCQFAQGYYYAKPMDSDAIRTLLRQYS